MGINQIADSLIRQVETVGDTVSQTLFEPVIRIGVTGLARSGKTVFITSLIANMLDRGRMPQLLAHAEGRIEAAYLQPQPDDTVPRFDYETHLAAMTGPDPQWPDSTRAVSQLRLSLRLRPQGLLSGLQGPRTVHLDIVDYPGEWLLDLGLLDKSYAEWSSHILNRFSVRPMAQPFLALAKATDTTAKFAEADAQHLAMVYTDALQTARHAGFSDCAPGRFLLPGELAGSPALTFAPLPVTGPSKRGTLHREMERRYEAYKARIVKPFFQDHFARIDRQVVLVDALSAIHAGPAAVEDLRQAMADTLGAFRPGRNAWLSRMLGGKKVEKILFAATKADHLHHTQHSKLGNIMEALTREARDRADFAGAKTHALSLASLRVTTETSQTHEGRALDCVQGRLAGDGRQVAFYPGALPDEPAQLLTPARQGAETWLDADYSMMQFAPASLSLKPGDGPPHIRLDRAAQFLFGDKI